MNKTPIEIALDIDETGHTTAKKLYTWLELRPGDYSRWIVKNITENPYAEIGKDYTKMLRNEQHGRGRFREDYLLTATFAKKLAMSSRSWKGEETRDYFIKVEEALFRGEDPKTIHVREYTRKRPEKRKKRQKPNLKETIKSLEERIRILEAIVAAISDGEYTVLSYAAIHGIDIIDLDALVTATCAVAKEHVFTPIRTHDEGWGSLYIYPEWLLEEAFQRAGYGNF